MKRLSIIVFFGLLSILFFPLFIQAQEKPYIVLEYMQVNPVNDSEYMEIENFWREIHKARFKNGSILGWSVWSVRAPFTADAPYQYIVLTVYPSFSNYLKPFKGLNLSKIFPNVSKDSLSKIFSKTEKVRTLTQSDVFYIEDDIGNPSVDSINYLMATFVKVEPDKMQPFTSFMEDHWKPVANKVVKGGYARFWWHGHLVIDNGINAPYNHIMMVCWNRDDMFEITPPFDQYRKEDPVAFEGYKWYTRSGRVLLEKVISLTSPPKAGLF